LQLKKRDFKSRMPFVDASDLSNLISVQQSIRIIDSQPVSPRIEDQDLRSSAGRILAQNVQADRDFPPFDKSLVDGIAIRAGDLGKSGGFRVVAEVSAGMLADREINPGECMTIMTGAPIPEGADRVVPIEFVRRTGDVATVEPNAPTNDFIARRASDMARDAQVLHPGQTLGAAQIAVCASVGVHRVRVFARPRVTVLSTGNEIVPIDIRPGPAQIRDSNRAMLCALLTTLGCEVIDSDHSPDDPIRLKHALRSGLESDALFVSGGVSMGAHDYVPALLSELGVALKITKLRVKPGKPFVFGVKRHTTGEQSRTSYVFGLPGNPVSAFACTLRLARRLLDRLQGREPVERWIHARLGVDLPANGPREFYQPATYKSDGTAHIFPWKGSGDLFTLAQADSLLVRPENDPPLSAGAAVSLLEIPI
jgi:molybdopterin molybdotransferase